MQDEFETELSTMFAEADAALPSEAFVAAATRRIQRMELVRRALLAVVAAIGVLIIGSQLPALAGALTGVDAMPSLLSASLSEGLGQLTSVEPFWLAVGASLVVSLLATFMIEEV